MIDYGDYVHYRGPPVMNTITRLKATRYEIIEDARDLIALGSDVNGQDRRGRTSLHFSIENNDLEKTKVLINYAGADFRIQDKRGLTPLHLATKLKDPSILNFLLSLGARDNVKTKDGDTALELAIFNGNLETAKTLIESGSSNVNSRDKYDRTPLHKAAAKFNNVAIVKSLLSQGADCNLKNDDGESALKIAIVNDNLETAKILIQIVENIDSQDKWGNTALQLAVEKSSDDTGLIKSLLLRGADVKIKNKNGVTALMHAVIKDNLEVAQLLIDAGADVNCQDESNRTLLHMALEDSGKNLSMAKLLINSGVNVNVKDKSGRIPLHLAAANSNDASFIRDLISRTAGVDHKTDTGDTALFFALRRNNIDTAKVIIKYTKNLNLQDKNGETALHLASYSHKVNDPELTEDLLSRGANVELKDNDGFTALHSALFYTCWINAMAGEVVIEHERNLEVLKILLNAVTDVNSQNGLKRTYLHLVALLKNHLSLLHNLLSRGADVNATDYDKNTALQLAVGSSNLESAKILIKLVKNINHQDKNGRTVLHVSASYNDASTVQDLLSRGADVNKISSDGETALHVAVRYGTADTMVLLIDAGSDVNSKVKTSGDTPLHLTLNNEFNEKNYLSLMQYLLSCGAKTGVRNNDGKTALQIAIARNDLNAAKILIQADEVSANVKDIWSTGNTALHLVTSFNDVATIKYLMSIGAINDLKNKKGQTPLHIALYRGNVETVLALHGKTCNKD